MNTELVQSSLLSPSLGWLFVALSGLFLLGLIPRMARTFYPLVPSVVSRAAAPVLFALLAVACFGGWGIEALGLVAMGGTVQIIAARRIRRRYENPKDRRSV